MRGLPTYGFRLEENIPHPGAFLRVPGRGSSRGSPSEVPALTSRSLPSGRMLAGAFWFLRCGAAHGAVFHRGLFREPSSVSFGRSLEVRQSAVVLRGGLTEASGG
jgi:hypothetical protein